MLLRLSLQFNVLKDMAVVHDRLLCFSCGTIAQVEGLNVVPLAERNHLHSVISKPVDTLHSCQT